MATLVKRLVDHFPKLLEQVDLFAGTSTGSVVALTLASGRTADTLVDFYSIREPQICVFARPFPPLSTKVQ